MDLSLFDPSGNRKYLTLAERRAFLTAAELAPKDVRTFCLVLAFTGCRLSEAVELTLDRVDLSAGTIIFESKKKQCGVFRAVPVPGEVATALDLAFNVRDRQKKGSRDRLWRWSLVTAWRRVGEVMDSAGVTGPQATPKGLRHAFGVHAVSAGIPLNMVQKWLGHAQLTTTAIYANAVGAEEKSIASTMWG